MVRLYAVITPASASLTGCQSALVSLGTDATAGATLSRRATARQQHLLRDVESVCENVIVFNMGKVAAKGVIAQLTGTRRSVYELRIKGEPAGFLTDLKDHGCDWPEGEDGYRVFLTNDQGPELLFRIARECGVQIRHLRPGAESLEDVFLRALGHEVQQ